MLDGEARTPVQTPPSFRPGEAGGAVPAVKIVVDGGAEF